MTCIVTGRAIGGAADVEILDEHTVSISHETCRRARLLKLAIDRPGRLRDIV